MVFSKDEEDVFRLLQKYGLHIKPGKCLFGVTDIDFLGHNVSEHDIKPSSEKISAIRNLYIWQLIIYI